MVQQEWGHSKEASQDGYLGCWRTKTELSYKQNVQPLTGSPGDFLLCVTSSCWIPQSLRRAQPVRKMLRTAAPISSPTLLPVFPSDELFWKMSKFPGVISKTGIERKK